MTERENKINLFSTRIRQLILLVRALKEEKKTLLRQVEDMKVEKELLEEELVRVNNNLNTLKTAKMLQVSDNDYERTRKRLNKLVRDVNRCITLISGKEEEDV